MKCITVAMMSDKNLSIKRIWTWFFFIGWSKNGSFTHFTDVSLVAHRTVTGEGWVAPGCPLTDATVEAGPLSTGVSIICRKWWTQVWIDFCIQGKFSPMLFSPFYTKKWVCPILNSPTQSCEKLDYLKHWNSPSFKFALWQPGELTQGQKFPGIQYIYIVYPPPPIIFKLKIFIFVHKNFITKGLRTSFTPQNSNKLLITKNQRNKFHRNWHNIYNISNINNWQ